MLRKISEDLSKGIVFLGVTGFIFTFLSWFISNTPLFVGIPLFLVFSWFIGSTIETGSEIRRRNEI